MEWICPICKKSWVCVNGVDGCKHNEFDLLKIIQQLKPILRELISRFDCEESYDLDLMNEMMEILNPK